MVHNSSDQLSLVTDMKSRWGVLDTQGERYSFAHFVYPRHSTVIQGPQKKYPAVTFERFMVEKSKGFAYTLPKDPKVRKSFVLSRILVPCIYTPCTCIHYPALQQLHACVGLRQHICQWAPS